MLQRSAIEPSTLELLKQLMNVPELQNFSLAVGTANVGWFISVSIKSPNIR